MRFPQPSLVEADVLSVAAHGDSAAIVHQFDLRSQAYRATMVRIRAARHSRSRPGRTEQVPMTQPVFHTIMSRVTR